mgnify:CR=1 FL=1|tara:strand:- start:15877 stop:16659 length:783 start_codon:yes stop_codon:yes gene_type:complete
MSIIAKFPDRKASCALIGYKNLLVGTTGSSSATKVLTPNTYERLRLGIGSFSLRYQLSSPGTINFVGVAAHNFGTHDNGVNLMVKYANTVGGALTTIGIINFENVNDARMLNFDDIPNVAEIELSFTTLTTGLEIGVLYAGETLQMQQPMYGGLTPINLAGVTEYQSINSETGQFLGRTITSKGLSSSFSWRHLDDLWIRETFKPFIESARSLPFFIKWRPDYYDSSVFGYTTADIKPANMGGGHRLMSVSFNMRGHQDI